jgi:phosphoglycerol geranylgeranyltransferase
LYGRIESELRRRLADEKALHFMLLDPQKSNGIESAVRSADRSGTAAILVGGSTAMLTTEYDTLVRRIKSSSRLPVIIFPSNLPSITGEADAIFFMSLMNSLNPYFITGAQALGINAIRERGLEAIPMAYIIIGLGGAAGFVGQAQCIPLDHPEIAASYAMAAEAFGFRFVYLESGSGVAHPLSPSYVSLVRKSISIPLIVGGGVRSGTEAEELVAAGADIIVTGSIVEEVGDHSILSEIVDGIRRGGMRRQ